MKKLVSIIITKSSLTNLNYMSKITSALTHRILGQFIADMYMIHHRSWFVTIQLNQQRLLSMLRRKMSPVDIALDLWAVIYPTYYGK